MSKKKETQKVTRNTWRRDKKKQVSVGVGPKQKQAGAAKEKTRDHKKIRNQETGNQEETQTTKYTQINTDRDTWSHT